ncbi:hypothetical protein NC652_007730 [Populus alba x Populus x berolinensis]|nr:hypothetical protein NC652_007730 [Populus alba x Populus x berolinensis]
MEHSIEARPFFSLSRAFLTAFFLYVMDFLFIIMEGLRTPQESQHGDAVMEATVRVRNGSVLGKGSILKNRTSSHIQIHGAPNVYKHGNSTIAGAKEVLAYLKAKPKIGGSLAQKVILTDLSEEAATVLVGSNFFYIVKNNDPANKSVLYHRILGEHSLQICEDTCRKCNAGLKGWRPVEREALASDVLMQYNIVKTRFGGVGYAMGNYLYLNLMQEAKLTSKDFTKHCLVADVHLSLSESKLTF